MGKSVGIICWVLHLFIDSVDRDQLTFVPITGPILPVPSVMTVLLYVSIW